MAFNPTIHTATNKPLGISGKPADARSYMYDEDIFGYRPYNSVAEVLAYLPTALNRTGHFSVFVDDDGEVKEYWWKDDLTDSGLVEKTSGGSSAPSLSAKRIYGRYANTSGAAQQITIGDNLTLTDAGVLNASGDLSLPEVVAAGTYGSATQVPVFELDATGIVTGVTLAPISGGTNLGWYNVKDFGATGDGITDDTDAVQDTVDYCNSHGGGVVYFPKGIYRCKIEIPYNNYTDTGTQVSIKLLGEAPAVTNFNPFETTTARPVNQNGSIILGNVIGDGVVGSVVKSLGSAAFWTTMNFVDFSMENITVRLKSKNSSGVDVAPKDVAIDMQACAMMTLDNVGIDNESMSKDMVEPASTCVGIITPGRGNWTKNFINQVSVLGTYKGLIAYEHTCVNNTYFDANYYCVVIADSDHPMHFNRVGFWRYKYGLKVEGTTTRGFSIDQLALERNPVPGEWFDFVADLVEDSPGYAQGKIQWFNVHGDYNFIRTNATGSRIFDNPIWGNMPRWLTADRPLFTIMEGLTGYNRNLAQLEYWTGTAWKQVGPAGTDRQIQYNNAGNMAGFGDWDGSKMSIPGNLYLTGATGGNSRILDFGIGYGAPAIYLHNNGAGNRYGLGIDAGGEVQLFLPNTGRFTINKGGDFQASGTNEVFRLDEAIGILLAASRYINFGTTGGTTGYGFRDNAGTLQFKNNGGAWTNLGSGGSGVTINNNTNNKLLTATGGADIDAEAGLTWDGSLLTVAGSLSLAGVGGAAALINWNSGYGTAAFFLYDGGAAARYGGGVNGSELQLFVPNGAHFSLNKGGDFQGSGTNEFFRVESTGQIKAAGYGSGTTLTGTPNKYAAFNTAGEVIAVDAPTSSATNLDGLSDVVISSPSNGQVLKYNGTNWVNDTDSTGSGGISAVGALSADGNAKGASISGTDLIIHPATGSTPGVLTHFGAQSIGGKKTFQGEVVMIGGISASIQTQSDGDFAVLSTHYAVVLPAITANRTITLPAASNGRMLVFKNINNSIFSWQFNVAVKDASNTDLTALANGTTYHLICDNTTWQII